MKILFTPLLLFILIVPNYQLLAQDQNIKIIPTEKIKCGFNLLNGQDIFGEQIQFSSRIYKFQIDTCSKSILVELRKIIKKRNYSVLDNEGEFLCFDMNSKRVNWSYELDHRNGESITPHNKYSVINSRNFNGSANKATLISNFNEQELWHTLGWVLFVDNKNNVCVKCESDNFFRINSIFGLSLGNGKKLWRRKIGPYYSYMNTLLLNDSVSLIIADGIHQINMRNGNGWSYDATSSKYSLSFGVDMIKGILSNLITDELHYKIAFQDKFAIINKLSGIVETEIELPSDSMSSSFIKTDDSTVVLVNTGFATAYNMHSEWKYGYPFVSKYNLKTKKITNKLNLNESETILKTIFNKNDFTLVFKNKVAKYSNNTLQLIAEIKIDTLLGELCSFQIDKKENFIKKSTGEFQTFFDWDSTAIYIMTIKEGILKINHELTKIESLKKKDCYFQFQEIGNLKFISNQDIIIVINKYFHPTSQLNLFDRASFFNDRAYFIKDNLVTEIDLKQINEK